MVGGCGCARDRCPLHLQRRIRPRGGRTLAKPVIISTTPAFYAAINKQSTSSHTATSYVHGIRQARYGSGDPVVSGGFAQAQKSAVAPSHDFTTGRYGKGGLLGAAYSNHVGKANYLDGRRLLICWEVTFVALPYFTKVADAPAIDAAISDQAAGMQVPC